MKKREREETTMQWFIESQRSPTHWTPLLTTNKLKLLK